MRKRLGRRDARQLRARAPAEGAARRGNPQARHLARVLADEALVDGAVLRIDGHERTGGAVRRGRAGHAAAGVHLGGQRHDEVAAHHEGFLVRERQHLARAQRVVAGAQTRRAHERVHHHVGLGQLRERGHGLRAEAERAFAALGAERTRIRIRRVGRARSRAQPALRRPSARDSQRPDRRLGRDASQAALHLSAQIVRNGLARQPLVAHRKVPHAELARLGQQLLGARARRQRHHLQLVGMPPHHVERLRADGPRGP